MSDLVRKLPIQYTHPDGVDVNGGGGGGNSSSPQNDYVQRSELDEVAFTGDYDDLHNKPEIINAGMNYINLDFNDSYDNLLFLPYPVINCIVEDYVIPENNYEIYKRSLTHITHLSKSSEHLNLFQSPYRGQIYIIKGLPYFYKDYIFTFRDDYRFGQNHWAIEEYGDVDVTNMSDYAALMDVEVRFEYNINSNIQIGFVKVYKYLKITLNGSYILPNKTYAMSNYVSNRFMSGLRFNSLYLDSFIKHFKLVPDVSTYIKPTSYTPSIHIGDSVFEPMEDFLDFSDKSSYIQIFTQVNESPTIYNPKGNLINKVDFFRYNYDENTINTYNIKFKNVDSQVTLDNSFNDIKVTKSVLHIHIYLIQDISAENFLSTVTLDSQSSVTLIIHGNYQLLGANISENVIVQQIID